MARHVAILGFIYAILGVVAALGGVVVILFGWGGGLAVWLAGGHHAASAGLITALAGGGIGFFILASGTLNGITAIGILGRRPWGRILGIVVSVLDILPLTWVSLFGAYGLWVLLSKEGKREFEVAR